MLTRAGGFLTKFRASSESILDSSHDKIGLNLKFERAFVLALENILGRSAATHLNRNTTTYYNCPAHKAVQMAK